MKKLLAAALCALVALMPAAVFAQGAVSFTKITPEGARITVPVTVDQPLPVTGGGGGGGGGAGTIADGADVTQGSIVDAPCPTDGGDCTGQALHKRLNQLVTGLGFPLQDGARFTCGGISCIRVQLTNSAGNEIDLSAATDIHLTTADYGSAGTPNAHVLSVQGITNGTSQNTTAPDTRALSGSNITAADVGSSSASGQASVSIITGSPTANSTASLSLNGQSAVTLQVSGTFSLTGVIEGSADGGSTWIVRGGQLLGTSTLTSAVTGPGVWSIDATGMTNIRVRATAFTSGTLTAKWVSSPAAGLTKVVNGVRAIDQTYTSVPFSEASVVLSMSTATTTQLVALSSGKKIYVTGWDAYAAGTTNFKLVYGTGSNCGTGTTDLTGAYPFKDQGGIARGNGGGAVLVVPAGNALCATNSAAIQVSGSVAYAQF